MLEMFFKTLKWDKELTNMHTTSLSGKKLVTGQTDCVQITKVKYSLKKYQNYVNKTIPTCQSQETSEDYSMLVNSTAHPQGAPGAGQELPAAAGKLRLGEPVGRV